MKFRTIIQLAFMLLAFSSAMYGDNVPAPVPNTPAPTGSAIYEGRTDPALNDPSLSHKNENRGSWFVSGKGMTFEEMMYAIITLLATQLVLFAGLAAYALVTLNRIEKLLKGQSAKT